MSVDVRAAGSPRRLDDGQELAAALRDVLELGGRFESIELTSAKSAASRGSRRCSSLLDGQARIPTKGKKQRLYDLAALKTVLHIRGSLASGRTLAAAIAALPARPSS